MHHHSRWEAALAICTAVALYTRLPEKLTIGPSWLSIVVVGALLLPLIAMQRAIRRPGGWEPSHRTVRVTALVLLAVLAIGEGSTLVLLLTQLSQLKGSVLFRSAGFIWGINMLVFAVIYWELDGGGPARRPEKNCKASDFLFPQQTDAQRNKTWAPHFLDYLFLAFTTGTAFSPADTQPLTQEAKFFMMVQATISMLTIGLLAARAVNIV